MSRSYRRKGKAGSVITSCLATLLVAGSVGALAAASNGFRDWDVKGWSWDSLKFWEARKNEVTMDLTSLPFVEVENGYDLDHDRYEEILGYTYDEMESSTDENQYAKAYANMFNWLAGSQVFDSIGMLETDGGTEYMGFLLGPTMDYFTFLGSVKMGIGSDSEGEVITTQGGVLYLNLLEGKSFNHVSIEGRTYQVKNTDTGDLEYGKETGGLSVNGSDVQYYEGAEEWTTNEYAFDESQSTLLIQATGDVAVRTITFWTE